MFNWVNEWSKRYKVELEIELKLPISNLLLSKFHTEVDPIATNNPSREPVPRGWWSLRGVGARPENIRSRKNTKCFADYSCAVDPPRRHEHDRRGRIESRELEHDRSFTSGTSAGTSRRVNGNVAGILTRPLMARWTYDYGDRRNEIFAVGTEFINFVIYCRRPGRTFQLAIPPLLTRQGRRSWRVRGVKSSGCSESPSPSWIACQHVTVFNFNSFPIQESLIVVCYCLEYPWTPDRESNKDL